MKSNKYKILVLSDLKKSTSTTLKSTVSLAKMINGDIEFFHVKKPTDIVEKENQLSAMRTISEKHNITRKKIEKLIKSISEDYGVNVKHSFTFGNIKNEIANHIEKVKPDIIVVGKRRQKPINLIGDNLTSFVLKKHDGLIFIASDKNTIEPNKELTLAVLNATDKSFNSDFAEKLIKHTQKPLKSFKIIKKTNALKKTNEAAFGTNIVEYVFEESDNTIKNLSNYLSKNNINLLCFDREQKNTKNNTNSITANINDLIRNLNVSLLLTTEQKLKFQ